MGHRTDPDLAASKATEIVVAFLNSRAVEVADLPRLVREVRAALDGDERSSPSEEAAAHIEAGLHVAPPASSPPDQESQDSPPPTAAALPTIPLSVEDTLTPDYLVCLEDGQRFRSLRRHLMAKHGMTPEQYRSKWSLPADYPMVAPNYAAERSAVALRSGLGTSPLKGRGRRPTT
ncbi:MucR family transcriptional regulator [Caulobacter sp. KR2-114]|uniref:MucR family transcriptional regulator n=1 Tax=Caulobacter sp. KR2-114 TaxID=3400912 RepID=UPI003BFFA261